MKPVDFETIQRATRTPDSDLGLILENQRVGIMGRNGRISIRKYTIYRARIEGKEIVGNVHRKNDPDNHWPEYVFCQSRKGIWLRRDDGE